MPASARIRDVFRQRPLASLIVLCIVLLGIIWTSIAVGLRAERERAADAAMRETANRARLFGEFAARTVAHADETLRFLAEQYLRQGRAFDLEDFARLRLAHLEPWLGIAVIDGHGDVVLAFPGPAGRVNLRGRDSFRVHLDAGAPQPFIGVPHMGVLTGKWTVPITRRIERADGSFAGVVSIGLDPTHFSDFQSGLGLGSDSTATLVGRDGIVRARRANQHMTAGQNLSGFELFRQLAAAPEGSYATSTTLDGTPRFFGYRAMEDYPLIAVVGMSQAVAMHGYHRVAAHLLAWAALITAVTLAFAAVAFLQARRQAATDEALRASEARYRTFIGTTSRIVWTMDPSGRVVDDAPSWRAYTGQTFEQFRGDGWLQAIAPEDRPHVVLAWRDALRNCSVYGVEYRLLGSDGTYRPFACRAVPVYGPDGRVREWIGVVEDVTEKKQAERTRDLLARIVEHANDAIISRDLDGIVMSWNRAAERMFGYTAQEAIGRNIDFIRADESGPFHERNDRIRRGENVPPTQGLRRTKDNRILNVLFTAFPITGENGVVVGAAGIVRDVTETRRAAEMRALLAAIVENANDVILSRTLDGMVTSWNAAAERLFGYTAAEAIGRHISFILRDAPGHLVKENTERLRRGEAIAPLQTVRRAKDGRMIPVINSISRIVDEHGAIIGVAIMLRDITEQQKAEEALRLAAGVYENAAEGILITDAKNVVVSVNRAYSCITGYAPEDVTGRAPPVLASPEYAALHDGLWRSVSQSGRWQGEVWDRRKNDERYCALLSVSLIHDAEGEVVRHCWIFMDITARKRYEEQLLTLNAELEDRVAERTRKLEAANEELSAFSYSVSHDLRAPIRAIQGYSTLLATRDAEALSVPARGRLKRIQNNAEWMGQLIDDLLRLSRVSQRQLERRQFDLTALANEVVTRLRRAEPARAVDVAVQPGMVTNGDASLVRHVMENLIGNAWKFTGRTERARIEVGCERSSGGEVYYVRDNGAGFDMQYVHKLFSAFQRLHHRDEFEGTGIGLSIVQRVVAKHGGTVWASAEVGRGATFSFTLR